jgi:ribonuclease HI
MEQFSLWDDDVPQTAHPVPASVSGERVVAATDGSCNPNPGTAAGAWFVSADCWGAVLIPGVGTNNIGELAAIRELLRAVPAHRPVEIVYDSQYARDCLTVWVHGWSKGGRLPHDQWRRGPQREPVKNAALIAETVALLEGRTITWTKAKAHVALRDGGHALNHEVDARAGAVVEDVRAGRQPDLGPGWTS